MTGRNEGKDDRRSAPRRPGREAGFDGTRPELEEMAASELDGVVTDPKLLSNAGLWVTFLAREPCCGARVLLNVRSREHLDEETLDAVFRAAARSRDLRHPAVLSTRRFGRTDNVAWITTRAYRGRLLRVVTGAEPDAGRSRGIDLIRRVARPLEAAHRDGLVHGALGEASFHCDTGGRIRIRNLGLDVPLVRHLGRSGMESVTVACAAPEVLDGDVPVPESDQYALAALLVKLFTGRAPEPNGSVEWHSVPGPMRRPLRRALRVDPEERFSSVMDMWEALDPEQAGRRRDPSRRSIAELQPDEEMPGSPSAHAAKAGTTEADERVEDHGRRGLRRPGPPAGERPPRARPDAPVTEPAPPRRPSTMGSWGRRRRRGSRKGGTGPWARGFAAAAALVLLFGTVELAGEWDRLSPFASATPDTLGPNARAELIADRGGEVLSVPPAPRSRSDAMLDEEGPRAEDRWGEETDEQRDEDVAVTATDTTEATSATVVSPSNPGATAPLRTSPEPTPSSSPRQTAMSRSTPEEERDAEALEPGVLSLQSYPWGEVYLDGDFVGNSPILDLRVSAGPHEIRIEREGYDPYVEMVTVEPGEVIRRTGIVLRSETR